MVRAAGWESGGRKPFVEPSCTVGGNVMGAATVENSMEVPRKTELPYDPAIPLLGIYPGKTLIENSIFSKRYTHPYVPSSTIHNSQDMETT